jgi:hypothetical protein
MTEKLIEEVKALRAATVEMLDTLPNPDEREFTLRGKWDALDEALTLRGRRDALDEVLILLGVSVGAS